MSNFQMTALPLGTSLAALSREASTAAGSAFADLQTAEKRNIISNDGEGRMHLTVDGQPYGPPVAKLQVVIGGFEHATFGATRRQFYISAYGNAPVGAKMAPDCMSDDGVTPSPSAKTPQAAACKDCKFHKKAADARYGSCSHRKHFLLYLVQTLADGSQRVLTDIPFSFAASSKTLFDSVNEVTQNGGTHTLIPYLARKGVTFIERVVFEIDYASGDKAPLFRPIGLIPEDVAMQVTAAAKTTEAMYAIYKDELGVPLTRRNAAIAAPSQAPAYRAPVAEQQSAPVAPPAHTYVPQPPAQAPVYTPPPPPVRVEQAPAPQPVQSYEPAPQQAPPVAPPQPVPTDANDPRAAAIAKAHAMMHAFKGA